MNQITRKSLATFLFALTLPSLAVASESRKRRRSGACETKGDKVRSPVVRVGIEVNVYREGFCPDPDNVNLPALLFKPSVTKKILGKMQKIFERKVKIAVSDLSVTDFRTLSRNGGVEFQAVYWVGAALFNAIKKFVPSIERLSLEDSGVMVGMRMVGLESRLVLILPLTVEEKREIIKRSREIIDYLTDEKNFGEPLMSENRVEYWTIEERYECFSRKRPYPKRSIFKPKYLFFYSIYDEVDREGHQDKRQKV